MKIAWVEAVSCTDHPKANCDCDHKVHIWWLFTDEQEAPVGRIQCFHPGSSYYGTWPGGRTGAFANLEECKKEVITSTLGARALPNRKAIN